MPVLAAALDTWGARRETSTLPSRPHTNVGCAVVTRMTWRESIGLCDLQVQTKQVSRIYHWKYSPTKKTSTAKKAPLQEYHTWNSDSKSFLTLFFWGFPFPALFTWRKTANLRRFRFHPWSNSSQDEGWLIILYTFLSIKLCLPTPPRMKLPMNGSWGYFKALFRKRICYWKAPYTVKCLKSFTILTCFNWVCLQCIIVPDGAKRWEAVSGVVYFPSTSWRII